MNNCNFYLNFKDVFTEIIESYANLEPRSLRLGKKKDEMKVSDIGKNIFKYKCDEKESR